MFQDLPKVPVPPLEQTLSEYLRILEPVLTHQQHDKTKLIVKNFTNGLGPILQEYLQEKRENEDNWVSNINIYSIDPIYYLKKILNVCLS